MLLSHKSVSTISSNDTNLEEIYGFFLRKAMFRGHVDDPSRQPAVQIEQSTDIKPAFIERQGNIEPKKHLFILNSP
jgi:hypothetical protein